MSSLPCRLFAGLPGLRELAVNATGSQNVFGQELDLATGGFRGCSFADSIRSMHLHGLDLRSSEWTADTFAGLAGIEVLKVTSSSGQRSFSIAGDFLTPLVDLHTLDLAGNGIDTLPQLTKSPAGVLRSIDLRANPLDVVVANPFENLFRLESVHVDLQKTCDPGTVKQPVTVLNGEDAAVCVMCPAGHYCPDGLALLECAEGSYNPSAMSSLPEACITCPQGTTTTFPAAERETQCVSVPLTCAPGTAGFDCNACGPGTFSVGGNVQECGVCQPGTVSRKARLSLGCDECPAGSYMPLARQAGLDSCLLCGEGLVSDSGSSSCSGCTGGAVLDASSGTCVDTLDGECDGVTSACLPGLPEPVAAPGQISRVMASLPLPLGGIGSTSPDGGQQAAFSSIDLLSSSPASDVSSE